MIEINLLPEELRRKKMELPDISFFPVIVYFFAVLLIIYLFLNVCINFQSRNIRVVDKRWQEMLPEKNSAELLKAELNAMKTRAKTIDNLIQGRMSWVKKLDDLCDSMIPGIWLNKLWLEKKALYIQGSAVTTGEEGTALVGKFIRSLKSNPGFFADFTQIESTSIQRSRLKDRDVDVMNFELICYFK